MQLEPGDVIIVLKPSGQVVFWEQDTPEVAAYLEAVEELSTCDCKEDQCPAWEMPDWRERLVRGEW